MGQNFIKSVLAQDEAVTVSTTVTYDLPVNPLSHLLFTVKALNSTATITDYSVLGSLLSSVSLVEILFKGSAIVSASLTDLWAMASFAMGWPAGQANLVKTTGAARSVTVPILLGRIPYNPLECFPAVRRGELQMRITYAAAQTGVATLISQIETLELPDANPTAFLKYTTISKTPSATGDHNVDLPIGNDINHILLFGTTYPTAASYNASIGKLKLRIDSVDSFYVGNNWETLHNESRRIATFPYERQSHRFADAAAGETDTGYQQQTDPLVEAYALLDFNPLGDDNYLLATEGRSRVDLLITADVADAIRIIPAEIIRLLAPTS